MLAQSDMLVPDRHEEILCTCFCFSLSDYVNRGKNIVNAGKREHESYPLEPFVINAG